MGVAAAWLTAASCARASRRNLGSTTLRVTPTTPRSIPSTRNDVTTGGGYPLKKDGSRQSVFEGKVSSLEAVDRCPSQVVRPTEALRRRTAASSGRISEKTPATA